MRFETVAIWGMGLLGGSLGLALRERRMAGRIIGIGRNLDRLKKAKRLGTCDEITTNTAEGFADADLSVLCTPVTTLADALPELASRFKKSSIVTDVGSTKNRIVAVAETCFSNDIRFVGSHPMSGAEIAGVTNSRSDLYIGNPCFLTPTPKTDLNALAALNEFWQHLGSRVIITDPQRHDRLVSAISHVPHMTSVALALLVSNMQEDENFLASIAGSGFWGMTRLAKGDLTMWSEICRENPTEIAAHLDQLIAILQRIRSAVQNGEADGDLQKARDFRLELDQLRPAPRNPS